MPESRGHMNLVIALKKWVADQYFQGQSRSLLVDEPDSARGAKPVDIGGHVPDLFVPGLSDGLLVIGEAKTANDLENTHTKSQIEAFLRYCSSRTEAVFVMAVPWHMTRYARNLIANTKVKCGCEAVFSIVLDGLEG